MKRIISGALFFVVCALAFAESVGLVLSGGGAKGAYEVGVWKAMSEYGITDDTKVISGTSVGALNAAMFACCDEATVEKLWREEVGYSSFMVPDTTTLADITRFAIRTADNNRGIKDLEDDPYGINDRLTDGSSDFVNHFLNDLNYVSDVTIGVGKGILQYINSYLFSEAHSDGIFDRSAMEDMLAQYVSLEKINESGMDLYATALKKDASAYAGVLSKLFGIGDSVLYFKLNEQISDENVNDILMASSAFPLVYDSIRLNSDVVLGSRPLGVAGEYMDGGFDTVGGKNTPSLPVARRNDVDTMIVVYLKSRGELDESYWESMVSVEEAAGKKLIEIVPTENLGNIIEGTTNFDPENIKRLIDLGYADACQVLTDAGYKKLNGLQKLIKKFFK